MSTRRIASFAPRNWMRRGRFVIVPALLGAYQLSIGPATILVDQGIIADTTAAAVYRVWWRIPEPAPPPQRGRGES